MAKQIIETLIDDLDGSVATETVTFSFDGNNYTIDLSEANAAALREAMEPYVGAGTKIGRGFGAWRPGITPSRRQQSSRADNRAIREWAASNGHELSDRGRIPQTVVEAYEAAKKAPAALSGKSVRKPTVAASKPARRAPRKKAAPAVQFASS
ncbi:Lsr2 family protein [Actinoplanes sp. NPDC049118]|uniref:histone-like nucleoid-structuring protein Lsr2 n=1 Tax=Actinoplanes sp. NPDC049118 TaxID=3155769 RepID=UPI0033EBE38E